MKKLICKCCGGKINSSTYRCEYCGTQYEKHQDNIIRIETYQNPCRVYKAQMYMRNDEIEMLGKENASEIAIKQLSRNLAEAIEPNLEIVTEYDPLLMSQKISARVRIVEPKYIF